MDKCICVFIRNIGTQLLVYCSALVVTLAMLVPLLRFINCRYITLLLSVFLFYFRFFMLKFVFQYIVTYR